MGRLVAMVTVMIRDVMHRKSLSSAILLFWSCMVVIRERAVFFVQKMQII